MDYIISDKKLTELISTFLDNRVINGGVSRVDKFIIVYGEPDPNDVDHDGILFEYDGSDDSLYIYESFINTLSIYFPFGEDNLKEFIKFWFETNFHVKITFIR